MHIAYNPQQKVSKLIDTSKDSFNKKKLIQVQNDRLKKTSGEVGASIYQSPQMFRNLKKRNLNFQYD